MALKGTLDDLGIAEVIQLPQRGRQTGLLELRGVSGSARLFYERGDLRHAELGHLEGLEVLVELLDWEGGDFTFHRGQETTDRSLDLDLHHAMMQALKLRDERHREAQARREELGAELVESLVGSLRGFVSAHPYVRYSCLLDDSGGVIEQLAQGEAGRERNLAVVEVLQALRVSYPAKESGFRVVIDEGEEKVVLLALEGGLSVVIIATGNVPMGAVLIAAGKLGQAVGKE